MHSLSVATGVAIARLLDRPNAETTGAVTALVERARLGLVMGPSELTAAMMFAQPLVKAWPEHWLLAYLIGVDLGMKYLHDGFYISDIVMFVTDIFTLKQLKEAERQAFSIAEWSGIHKRFFSFRNALASVAVEYALFAPPRPDLAPNCVLDDEHTNVHVLVVSPEESTAGLREQLQAADPEASISTSSSLLDATQVMQQYYHDGTRVNLLCIDSALLLENENTADESAEIFSRSQCLSQQLEPKEALSFFACKPLLVVISSAAEQVSFACSTERKSSWDCVVPTRMTSQLLPVLLSICEV
ncbi:hypothetical protein AB1Y20_014414 [Prymnesium parvum]|uniref:Uncharacterized protein n=1 Tax=Prymnesium parvum TaxID=97485 RepID=A0AB34IFR9_PRYPA